MSKNRMSPPIRFQGFTEPWEQRKLGEIAEYKKGPFGSALKKDFFIPDSATSVKVYEQQNAINKNWNLSRYYISKEYAQKLKSFEVHAGDIIVSRAGTIGEIYELPAQSRSGIINQALMRIRVNEDIVCKDIFKLAFSNMIDSFSREFSNGSAIKNIPPFADLKPMKILLPNKAEQTIIGDFFTDIDKTITLHQRKLELMKKLKAFFLKNMFPEEGETVPRIRFKGFTGDWEQRKFGEIAEYKKGPFGSALKKDFFIPDSATSVKVYEQQNAINKNWNLSRYYISKEYAQKLKSFEVHAGDIIVSRAGTIGEIYELPAQSRSGIINQALMRIRVNEDIVCKDIFKLAFSNMIDSFSREFSNGSAIKNIPPFADLKPMKILLPNKAEQTIIGDFFTDIDKTITLHQRKIDQLQAMKKFMLQNLFV